MANPTIKTLTRETERIVSTYGGEYYLRIFHYVKGEHGVVQFMYSITHDPTLIFDYAAPYAPSYENNARIRAEDLGYHSKIPHFDNQYKMECDQLEQGFCYYDGSSLNAEYILKILFTAGPDAVWAELEQYYIDTFDTELNTETKENNWGAS